MPELPEVETVVRTLREHGLVGRTITDVVVRWPRTVDRPSVEELRARLRGQRIGAAGRRGKFLILSLSTGDSLLVHLRMTGKLLVVSAGEPLDAHVHIILVLDDGRQLRFHDTRKFGRIYLVDEPAEVIGRLGPEPIDADFTAADLQAMLMRRHRQLKPLLLDQTFLAGLGNIYVNEALWLARLHPERRSDTLSSQEVTALYEAMRTVLRKGIENLGTTLGHGIPNFYGAGGEAGRNQEALFVHGREGKPCPRCGASIQRLIVGQRASYVCPNCQPRNGETEKVTRDDQ
ncbi:MAG: DNA-formamidopyrimidine glycosylase [Ardenticatenaceae bacterium]|nr:DNA-formamidopyrimidine glycosylase [Ardenticatenaceae bacterium]